MSFGCRFPVAFPPSPLVVDAGAVDAILRAVEEKARIELPIYRFWCVGDSEWVVRVSVQR